MIKKTTVILMILFGVIQGAEIILPINELLQGDPNSGNALYKTHYLATLPDGTKLIGEYPGREYPYDLLYKGNPHEVRLYHPTCIAWFTPQAEKLRNEYKVGFVTLFNGFYKHSYFPKGDWNGIKVYEFSQPKHMDYFIRFCHSKNLRVITYLRTPARKLDYPPETGQEVWGDQSWEDTLTGMQLFLYHHNIDGVYGDGFNCGNIYDTVQFVKGLRLTVDTIAQRNGFANGILFSHCSESPWYDYPTDIYGTGDRQGLPDVMVRMIVDYINTGESMRVAPTDPNHFMMTNFHNDQGLGNALWYKIYHRTGSVVYPADVMTQAEIFRMNAELSGCQPLNKYNQALWMKEYWPIYLKKRQAYQTTN